MNDNIVKIRSLILGDGAPKICLPITAANREEMKIQAKRILQSPCDLVEWRVDFFEETDRDDWLGNVLRYIRELLGEMPILFTFRTKEEGGERSISLEEYERLNVEAAASGCIDAVDVEWNRGEALLEKITCQVHRHGRKVVASFHDFAETPEKETIISILCRMQELGADITKAAVMPQRDRDVLTLLDATVAMKEQYADRPYITMSMSAKGGISRLCGALTGSALTFATAGRASAPGQMDAVLVKQVLEVLQI